MDFWEGDSLTILCPYYNASSSSADWEYYTIYMVDKHMYELCVINDTTTIELLLSCKTPLTKDLIQVVLLSFSPTGRDFKVGHEYYIISTSGGKESNMDNMYHGACMAENMKLSLRFHGRRQDPGNTGGSSGGDSSSGSSSSNNNNNNNNNNNDNGADPPRTLPTQPPTQRTTTTTTTTEATTRPVVSTAPSNLTPNRPKPLGGGDSSSGGGGDGEPIPGSDGFPRDETVIHAGGGGNRGGRDSSINSGVIDDSGAGDSAFSVHGAHRCPYSLSRHWALALGLVISYVLAHPDLVRGR